MSYIFVYETTFLSKFCLQYKPIIFRKGDIIIVKKILKYNDIAKYKCFYTLHLINIQISVRKTNIKIFKTFARY